MHRRHCSLCQLWAGALQTVPIPSAANGLAVAVSAYTTGKCGKMLSRHILMLKEVSTTSVLECMKCGRNVGLNGKIANYSCHSRMKVLKQFWLLIKTNKEQTKPWIHPGYNPLFNSPLEISCKLLPALQRLASLQGCLHLFIKIFLLLLSSQGASLQWS